MLRDFVELANSRKVLYTAGPSSLLVESIENLQPCFGRGDPEYDQIEETVLSNILSISGQDSIVRLQGSSTLSIELACANFLYGNVLVVGTGYYSSRLLSILRLTSSFKQLHIDTVDYPDIPLFFDRQYDWILSCYTETSVGFKCDIGLLRQFADSCGSFLLLDATASIGLEPDHHLADICCFSSCKGLFGLTGASFVTYKSHLPVDEPSVSHYLRLSTHSSRGVTGPYHSILSLYSVLNNYKLFKDRVLRYQMLFNQFFSDYLLYPADNLPVLCTALNCDLIYKHPNAIVYSSRSPSVRNIVCHIGHVHMPLEHLDLALINEEFSVSI